MRKFLLIAGLAVALALGVAVGASGSSSKAKKAPAKSKGGTITEVMGTAPDSLDPGFGYTSQALEPDAVAYIPMVAYANASGAAGGKVIPGLATALPTVSKDGKTYTMTMRKGLVYSNGKPVKAGDFAWAIERAIKIPWGGSGSFLTTQIVGASAFAKGKAKTISGITTNDKTGKITIRLLAPYGAFDNVLAFPSQAPIPKGTPFRNLPTNPPPGVGPYKITNIKPNVSFSVVRDPRWKPLPGIPAGHVDINVKIQSNVTAGALSVLNNSADFFDWADVIPGALLPQVQAKAQGRYTKQVRNATYYFFMNTKAKPFSSLLARQAVIYAIDNNALARLGSGYWVPACYFLPPGLIGHPSGPCPYRNPSSAPNLAKGQALVKQSGMAGTDVTVWGEMRTPRRQFVDYYTNLLNQLGFKATEKIIADSTYFPTIGDLSLNAQTGFADWNQDFPNPIDFYAPLLAGDAILAHQNQNFGQVNDPKINAEVNVLGTLTRVPTSSLTAVAPRWQALDKYVAQQAYVAAWGYLAAPFFTSSRINYKALAIHPVVGWDYLTFQLK